MNLARLNVLVAAAACLAPVAAGAALGELPRGRLAFDLGLGPAQGGAPFVTLGIAIGIADTPDRRIDLRARFGVLATQEVEGAGDPWDDQNTYNGSAFMFELVHAWRTGRLEPYLSLGVASLRADLDVSVDTVPTTDDEAVGAFLGAGLRLPVGERTLLSVEGLYVVPSRSDMTWLSPTPQLGGASLLFGITWRLGPTAPSAHPGPIDAGPLIPPAAEPPSAPTPVPVPAEPAVAAEPPPPAAPAPPEPPRALQCEPPAVPSFSVRAQQAFLCRENPVAGGFFCTPRAVEQEGVDPAACERGCRRERPECPSPGTATGAACERCVAGCGEARWLPCSAASGAALEGYSCLVEAGRWGATAITVPAECRAPGGTTE